MNKGEFDINIKVMNGQIVSVDFTNQEENAANIGIFLNHLFTNRQVMQQVLQLIGESTVDDKTYIEIVQNWRESLHGNYTDGLVPAIRASEVFSR